MVVEYSWLSGVGGGGIVRLYGELFVAPIGMIKHIFRLTGVPFQLNDLYCKRIRHLPVDTARVRNIRSELFGGLKKLSIESVFDINFV